MRLWRENLICYETVEQEAPSKIALVADFEHEERWIESIELSWEWWEKRSGQVGMVEMKHVWKPLSRILKDLWEEFHDNCPYTWVYHKLNDQHKSSSPERDCSPKTDRKVGTRHHG